MSIEKFNVIAVISPARMLSLQETDVGRKLLGSKSIFVGTLENIQSDYPTFVDQLSERRLVIGDEALLVRDSYASSYIYLAEDAPLRTATRHLGSVTMVCRLLGASMVSCEYLEVETSMGSMRVDAAGETRVVKGSLSAEEKNWAQRLGKVITVTVFSGPTMPDVRAARVAATSRGIMNDPTVETLLDIAQLGIQKHEVTVELAEGSRRALQLAAGACVPGTAWANLGLSLEQAANMAIRMRILVHFGDIQQ